ncbi:MAG: hypothetical protein J0J10_14595 [Bosea sp.]|uniref:hypothetical protein n=1 Tax=Bosea sp. (in: a-proteobacteria) TaxID=1871050 RepID=UPI001AD0740F|nr:hypothetical protein [Bosea sp. (in: a-proteobacteria)]MBN9469992.1 hypothetical protein [Bosea sp. (in: a-proteobacteria)]
MAAFVGDGDVEHYPGWYALNTAQVIVIAERLRARAGRLDVGVEVDIEIDFEGVKAHVAGMMSIPHPAENHAAIGPFSWSNRSDMEPAFRALEDEIWAAFAISQARPEPVNFTTCLARGPWSSD